MTKYDTIRLEALPTYTVELDDLCGVIGTVTNALTGRITAGLRDGSFVVIGEPLCSGCDAPVSDGPCGCQIQAKSNRRAA